MRENLFRGKRTDNGEWVEGAYLHQTLFYGDPEDRHWIIEHGEFHCDYYNNYEVIPETVGQFTGLYDDTKWKELSTEEQALFLYPENGGKRKKGDWKGRPIFEGDILEVSTNHHYAGVAIERLGRFVVEFNNGCFMRRKTCSGDGLFHFTPTDEIKIIGNMHDNPELLEGD